MIAIVAMMVVFSGCGGAADATSEESKETDQAGSLRDGQARFFEHDILGANASYKEALEEDTNSSQARAGVALTSILLLPYDPAVSELLTCCLGADQGLSADRDVIYGEDGILYLLSLGVPFEADGGNPGIKTLLAEDLPWSRQKLDSTDSFFGGLDQDVNEIFDRLQAVALALEPIEEQLAKVGEDESFESFFVPGEAFHDPDLSLVLGKTELAIGRAALGGTRTFIQFFGAYEYSWSLNEAFGPRWEEITVQDEDYVDGWTYSDYVTNFLSERLFREVRNPERLENARSAALATLAAVRDSIRLGLDGQAFELGWDQANEQVGREIDDLLASVENSLTASTPVPYTNPAVSMDLRSFFETPGRTLDAQTPWLQRTIEEDDFGGEFVSWNFTDEAVQSFFISDVFTPEFTVDEAPELQFSGDEGAFSDSLFDGIQSDVEDAYFSGR